MTPAWSHRDGLHLLSARDHTLAVVRPRQRGDPAAEPWVWYLTGPCGVPTPAGTAATLEEARAAAEAAQRAEDASGTLVLRHLFRSMGAAQTEADIAHATGLDAADVQRALAVLGRGGLVTREPA